jgi:hypothetical protein
MVAAGEVTIPRGGAMSTLEMTLGAAFAIATIAVALFFIVSQQHTLRRLRMDNHAPPEVRRFLIRQAVRRTFGCVMLILLALMVLGSLFLDYEPLNRPIHELPPDEQAAAKDALRFLTTYMAILLLVLLAVMILAVFDLWATFRHSIWQQKQLVQEHQAKLEAELAEYRRRQE